MIDYCPKLTLTEGTQDLVLSFDASKFGYGCVMKHHGKVITPSSGHLKIHETSYRNHDLEFAIVVYILKLW